MASSTVTLVPLSCNPIAAVHQSSPPKPATAGPTQDPAATGHSRQVRVADRPAGAANTNSVPTATSRPEQARCASRLSVTDRKRRVLHQDAVQKQLHDQRAELVKKQEALDRGTSRHDTRHLPACCSVLFAEELPINLHLAPVVFFTISQPLKKRAPAVAGTSLRFNFPFFVSSASVSVEFPRHAARARAALRRFRQRQASSEPPHRQWPTRSGNRRHLPSSVSFLRSNCSLLSGTSFAPAASADCK